MISVDEVIKARKFCKKHGYRVIHGKWGDCYIVQEYTMPNNSIHKFLIANLVDGKFISQNGEPICL
jgi:hypothetical protein